MVLSHVHMRLVCSHSEICSPTHVIHPWALGDFVCQRQHPVFYSKSGGSEELTTQGVSHPRYVNSRSFRNPLSEQDSHIKLGVTKTSPAHRCQTEGITHPSTQQTGSSLCPVSVPHIVYLLWALVQNSLTDTHTAQHLYARSSSCHSQPSLIFSACLSQSPLSGT